MYFTSYLLHILADEQEFCEYIDFRITESLWSPSLHTLHAWMSAWIPPGLPATSYQSKAL